MSQQKPLPTALEEWQQWAAEHPAHDDHHMVPVTCDLPLIDDLTTVSRLAWGLVDELRRHRRDHPVTPTALHLMDLLSDVTGRIPDRVSMLWDQLGKGHPLRKGFEHDFNQEPPRRKDT